MGSTFVSVKALCDLSVSSLVQRVLPSCFFLQGLQSAYFFWFTGCKNKNHGALLKELMQTSNFRVTVVEEYDVVEICGALKVSSQCRICLLATRLQNMDSHLDFNTGLFMVSRTNDYFCALSKSHTKQSRGILSLVPVFFFPPQSSCFTCVRL